MEVESWMWEVNIPDIKKLPSSRFQLFYTIISAQFELANA